MKRLLMYRLAFSAALLLSAQPWAQQMTVDQLPAAVRQTANTETKNGPVTKAQRIMKDGRAIYDITFQQPNGAQKNIYLEENGTYVQAGTGATSPSSLGATINRQVSLSEVPEAVRREINTETANGPLKRIQERPYNGREIYEVAMQKGDGSEKLIYLNVDGSYVQDQPAVGGAAAVGTQTGGNRSPLAGSTSVSIAEVPVAAQNAIRLEAGGGAIESINKGTLNGKTVYQAAFQQGARTVHLRVDEAGNIIQDVNDRMILSRGPLAGATQVTLAEVPTTVQNSIHTQLGNIALEQVQKGMVNGRVVYQALYRSNGQLMQIRLNENGRVLQSPITVNQ